MALVLKKSNYAFNRLLCRMYSRNSLNFLLYRLYSHSKAIIECETGPIDEFTSRLMQQKFEKWELRRAKPIDKFFEQVLQPATIYERVKIDKGGENHIIPLKCLPCDLNVSFQKAFQDENKKRIFELAEQCIDLKKIPSISVLISVLSLCSKYGEKEKVLKLSRLCEELRPDIFKKYSHFQHFLAEAIWIKGDIVRSLQMFGTVYKENSTLRIQIRTMLKYLICGIITSRSEAALVSTISFCEQLSVDFDDILPLSYVWQACFLSEWYCDQCIALKLFEKNEVLRKNVTGMIPYVTAVSLQSDRTDVLYRLLEQLLKYDMKFHCTTLLLGILNYQIHQRDMRSCSEILKWSVDNGINLPTIHHVKLVNLLLGQDNNVLRGKREDASSKTKTKPHFKF